MKKILVIGAGPSGLACAFTLQAAQGLEGMPVDYSVELWDEGQADIRKAELHEVPGIPFSMRGDILWDTMRAQAQQLSLPIHAGRVIKVNGVSGDFQVHLADGRIVIADIVVVATGYKNFQLEFVPPVTLCSHPYSPKNRPCLSLDAPGRVREGLFAAGPIAGVHSMFASSIGSGTEVACLILGDMAGHPIVVHHSHASHS